MDFLFTGVNQPCMMMDVEHLTDTDTDPTAERQLVEQLEHLRGRLGLSHRDYAAYLGIHPSTWSLLLSGQRLLGPVVLLRILRRHPEYFRQVLSLGDVA